MLQIITKIPLFVWPLFTILLVGGLRARKTSTMPLFVLFLFPTIFFSWSVFSFFGNYTAHFLTLFLWVFCLCIGFVTGFSHMQKLELQFDKKKRSVKMPGSWIPLILSMSIFGAKFSVGMISAMFPHLRDSSLLLGLELFATFIIGIFAGRGICCLLRYKAILQPPKV